MQRWMVSSVLAATLLIGAAFAQTGSANKSLYDRLGGKPAIEAVANGLVDRILADSRVNKWFTHAAATPENTKTYKSKLAVFICANTGGPCKYEGPDMVAAHKGRAVTSEAFDAVAQDLAAQLDQLKVPAKEKSEVMTLIGSLKGSIVQSGAGGR